MVSSYFTSLFCCSSSTSSGTKADQTKPSRDPPTALGSSSSSQSRNRTEGAPGHVTCHADTMLGPIPVGALFADASRQEAPRSSAAFESLPRNARFDSLGPRDRVKMKTTLQNLTTRFVMELQKGKVFLKLGRNGRLFYRWCTIDAGRSSFSMNVKGQIVEYPFSQIQSVRFGFDLSDFFQVPLSMPSESLGGVLILNDNRRLNLVFSSPDERDQFVSCMLVLLADHRMRDKA
ncbi:unnamed protein product [Amoebophrya sp. A25]|nr:unnamed protein product [Amoebophrya sp. A25]|eukprot:GSA25T00014459001.1